MSEEEKWRLRFERERTARREAEDLLHAKSRELYTANQELAERANALASSLEQLKDAQDQLVHRERMAALGGLVAGIAHEINTPLGVAVTAVTHVEERLRALEHQLASGQVTRGDLKSAAASMREGIGLALANLARGAGLIQSFKKVAVDQTSEEPREACLEDVVRDIVLSLSPLTRSARVTVEVTAPERTLVRMDAGGFAQVLTNLVQNACVHAFDAAQKDRRLSLELETTLVAVVLSVSDNGVGMEPSVAARIFEPFFTTRRGSGGSGLGMNIVHNVVTQRFGGTLDLETAPGEGTRFTLTLPFGSGALVRT